MTIAERSLGEGDLDQMWQLEGEAFNAAPAHADWWKSDVRRTGFDRWHGLFDADRLAAMAAVLPFRQWFARATGSFTGRRSAGAGCSSGTRTISSTSPATTATSSTAMRNGPTSGRVSSTLAVRELLAATPEALRALWRMLGAPTSPFVPVVSFRGAPHDPLSFLLPAHDVSPRRRRLWMLRLVDAPGAIAARGYAPRVEARVSLEIADDECPSNAGRFVLVVEDGGGRLERGGRGDVRRRRSPRLALQRLVLQRVAGAGRSPGWRLGCRPRGPGRGLRWPGTLAARRVLSGRCSL
jgi:hypothetical protein